ncbi:MAG: MEKHLA domain-containing protein [Nodosilinea sp.]
MPSLPEPSVANDYLADHVSLLRYSYSQLCHRPLLAADLDDVAAAQAIYTAPFVVVSHDDSDDPVFTYGNQMALQLFEMTWAEFTALPSRLSAEPPNRDERARLLEAVSSQGFVTDYVGVRIAKTGKRFWIRDVTVWNLRDRTGTYRGQAATYSRWQYL